MRLSWFIAALSLAAFAGLPVHAQEIDRIKAELKKRIPEAPVDTVRKISYGGLYEVVVGGDIYSTDEKASFLIAGSIIDLKTKENVTEARMRQVNAIKFDSLPLDQAVKVVRGNGSRRVAIFEDPNCGYCKRFERDLMGVNDLTVYVFLYPILSPDSLDKSKLVWCSPDRAKAWLDIMVRDTAVSGSTTCATPLDQNLALGKEKRVTGTPTIIFENGERIPGAMPIADFEKKLAELKTAVPTASAK
jgi:thiol:disulfide interchange protein DsbC